MRVLVTGGTGFIGSNIAAALIVRGDEVLITGPSGEQVPKGFSGKVLPTFVDLDWSTIGHIDALFHEAAINDTQSKDEKEMMRINLEGSKTLFENAVKNGCKKIIYASSAAVYGDGPAPYKEDQGLRPLTYYAQSKVLLDEWAMQFGKEHPDVRVIGLRYSNVFGPGESHKGKRASMIYQLAQQMKKGNPKLFKFGEQKRDFVYIDDVVEANILALDAKENAVLNCGSGKAESFNAIVDELNTVMSMDRKVEYFDNPIADTFQNFTEHDMSKAKKILGFTPKYDLKSGIEAYAKSSAL